MRVLVVDDDPSIRSVVAMALEGMEVTAVPDGLEALALLADEHFDVAIVDVMMPHMDGYAVVAHLRRTPAHRAVPVIMLTARVEEADHLRGFRAGADAYVTKPFDVDHLVDLVTELHRRSPREREEERRRELSKAELLHQIEHLLG